jgi:hypothetical protein
MRAGDSDCGPEGQARRLRAAAGQRPTTVGTNTTVGELWRIVEGFGFIHRLTCGFPPILPGL